MYGRRRVGIGLAAVGLVALLGTTNATAQTALGVTQQSSSAPKLVEREEAARLAEASFAKSAERLLNRLVDAASGERRADEPELEKLVATAAGRFSRALHERLDELEGDGLLTAAEVTSEVDEVRDEQLARLQEELEAELHGVAAPPVRDESESFFPYLGELLRYTIVTRNTPGRWLIVLLCIVSGILVATLAAYGLRRLGPVLRERNHRNLPRVVTGFKGPLYLAAATLGIAFGLEWIWIPIEISEFVTVVLSLLFAFAVFWLAWNLCGAAGAVLGVAANRTTSIFDDKMVQVVQKGLRLFALVVFVLYVAQVILDTDVKGVFAGLGILGLAISLAAQDTLKNVIASFTIYGDRPFRVGDLVKFQGYFGTAEEVGFRSTKVRTLDGHLVTIPNNELVKQPVENVSARPFIRRRFRLDLAYGTRPAKLREALDILNDILGDRSWQPEDEPPHVILEELGEHSYRVLVQYCFQPADYWKALENDTRVNLEIVEKFEKAGIELAFPTETVYLRTDEEVPLGLHRRESPTNGRDAGVEAPSR